MQNPGRLAVTLLCFALVLACSSEPLPRASRAAPEAETEAVARAPRTPAAGPREAPPSLVDAGARAKPRIIRLSSTKRGETPLERATRERRQLPLLFRECRRREDGAATQLLKREEEKCMQAAGNDIAPRMLCSIAFNPKIGTFHARHTAIVDSKCGRTVEEFVLLTTGAPMPAPTALERWSECRSEALRAVWPTGAQAAREAQAQCNELTGPERRACKRKAKKARRRAAEEVVVERCGERPR